MVNLKYANGLGRFAAKWLRIAVLLYLAMAIMSCLILLSLESFNPLEWNALARSCVVIGSFLIALIKENLRG
jgi:hypothetical protein